MEVITISFIRRTIVGYVGKTAGRPCVGRQMSHANSNKQGKGKGRGRQAIRKVIYTYVIIGIETAYVGTEYRSNVALRQNKRSRKDRTRELGVKSL